jgi:hypothetical protein
MTQETFTDNVLIDGSRDISQLTVEGHSTQDEALQTWQDSAQTPVAKVTGDGRLQVGDFELDGTMVTVDALIEAHRGSGSTKPHRGLHVAGVVDEQMDAVAWSVHELDVSGVNTDLTEAVALRAGVENDGSGSVDTAIGVQVLDVEGANRNYSIHTGSGTAHFGHDMELPLLSSTPSDEPPTDFVKVYLRSENGRLQWFGKDASGVEHFLSGEANTIHKTIADEYGDVAPKFGVDIVATDRLLVEDSADGFNKKFIELGSVTGSLSHRVTELEEGDLESPHYNVNNEFTSHISLKSVPANDDVILIEDSEDSFIKKYITVGNLPSSGGGNTSEIDVLAVQVFS